MVSRVRKAGIPSILGNQEIELRTLADRARPDPKRHMLWTIAVLKRKNREYLLGLPADRELEVEGVADPDRSTGARMGPSTPCTRV